MRSRRSAISFQINQNPWRPGTTTKNPSFLRPVRACLSMFGCCGCGPRPLLQTLLVCSPIRAVFHVFRRVSPRLFPALVCCRALFYWRCVMCTAPVSFYERDRGDGDVRTIPSHSGELLCVAKPVFLGCIEAVLKGQRFRLPRHGVRGKASSLAVQVCIARKEPGERRTAAI